ncbi:MAG: sensor histidine kinase [Streptococcaceae bacterium]|jgi:NarL family two-component system sensor histidine kinase LiaS|nr:sensor histidine kinase [Streptococcaceae bacterium]
MSRVQLFFFSLFSFTVALFLLFYFTTSSFKESFISQLFSIGFQGIPSILYLLLFGILFAVLYVFSIYFFKKRGRKRDVALLNLLNRQEYEKLERSIEESEESSETTQSIYLAAEKMKQLSNQIQNLDKGETTAQVKEEVLKEERQRISRELHDSVSQQLFAANMILSGLKEVEEVEEGSPKIKQLSLVLEIIQNAQNELRALLLQLRPVELAGKNLKTGIQNLMDELSTKIQIRFVSELHEVKIASKIEDELFRMTQELLSNTLKHAKAATLKVNLNQSEDLVKLIVEDDGIGFDTTVKKDASYGLIGIKERVDNLGGTFSLISILGQGTKVVITIPVLKEEKDDSSVISG